MWPSVFEACVPTLQRNSEWRAHIPALFVQENNVFDAVASLSWTARHSSFARFHEKLVTSQSATRAIPMELRKF